MSHPYNNNQQNQPPAAGNNGYVWVARSLSQQGSEETTEEELHTGRAEVLLGQKERHAARVTGACWC
jgi:hypothetical protein